jgi:hypothetical protein
MSNFNPSGKIIDRPCFFPTTDINEKLINIPPHMKHFAPILIAMRDRGLVGKFFVRGHKLPLFHPSEKSKPKVVIICDNLFGALGPNAFHRKSLRRILPNAGRIVLHCAAPLPEHYEFATSEALTKGSAVVIESMPERETEWLAFIYKNVKRYNLKVITAEPLKYASQSGCA